MGAVIAIIAIILGGLLLIVFYAMLKIGSEGHYMDEFYRQRKVKHGAKKTKKTQSK